MQIKKHNESESSEFAFNSNEVHPYATYIAVCSVNHKHSIPIIKWILAVNCTKQHDNGTAMFNCISGNLHVLH